jgi:hypothetical protein
MSVSLIWRKFGDGLASIVMVSAVLVLAIATQAARDDLKSFDQSSDPDLALIGCSRAIDEAPRRGPKVAPAQADHNCALSLDPTLAGAPQQLDQPGK